MASGFFAILSRLKYINRWALMRNTQTENLSEHTLDTAFIAHALIIIDNKRFGGNLNPEHAAVLAMYHDVTEIMTGDMPTPVKYFNADLKKAYKVAEKSAQNLLNSIENSKSAGLARLLFALGIRHVGKQTAEALASHFETVENIMNAEAEKLCAVDDIGSVVADSIIAFFSSEYNKLVVEKLVELGVDATAHIEKKGESLNGMTFVITGTLPGYSRNEAGELITSHGGKVSSSVSKNTSYLLAGADGGSKLQKAEKLSVPIISLDELLGMINE